MLGWQTYSGLLTTIKKPAPIAGGWRVFLEAEVLRLRVGPLSLRYHSVSRITAYSSFDRHCRYQTSSFAGRR